MRIEDLTPHQREKITEFGVNTWFVMDLLENYLNNPESVGEDWQTLFRSLKIQSIGSQIIPKLPSAIVQIDSTVQQIQMPQPIGDEEAILLKGVGERIVENMNRSLTIPTATSLRTIPVKVLEENRRIINNFLRKNKDGKVSYTHIIGWAIVKATQKIPALNNAFTVINNQPHVIKKKDINLGIAVDLEKKDGSRSLIVPNIKKANLLSFKEYHSAYEDIIFRSRTNKIDIADFQGTSITLTNPGTLGTVASNPRLMIGQGAIIATGAIDYPAEYQAVTQDVINSIGISKVMNVTSTYDHRIIQGAESGLFLQKIHKLLIGEENFYEELFESLKLPVKPVHWLRDNNPEDFVGINNIQEIEKQAKTLQMINMFRVRGHLLAHLDPLKHDAHYHRELDSATYGLTIWDYDREFIADGLAGRRTAKLREILEILHQTYCDKIGIEYRHIQNVEEKLWLQKEIETSMNIPDFDTAIRKNILYKLIQAENFEKFIDKKYIGHKRFSLEGSETIIPVLDMLLNLAAEDKVQEIVLGMAHRGRLNILANVIGKSMQVIFSEFEDIHDEESTQGSGDVKYHLGASGFYKTMNGAGINVSVSSNPSHLEYVNPVVEGIVRAKQTRLNDTERNLIVPVLLHGDAAFAGEGIVAETLNLSQLRGYSTGGTIHIIINNQIGFTTSPVDARSTVYATDVAKMIQAPIFHVNGDDPEAALHCIKLAYEYRMKFHMDVVIDVFGYRRLGHNEADEPAFTQPLLYKLIRVHPSVKTIYERRLKDEKIVSDEDIKIMEDEIYNTMNLDYGRVKKEGAPEEERDEFSYSDVREKSEFEIEDIKEEHLNQVVEAITTLPETFSLHPKLKKFIESRREFLNKDVQIDWSFAEALAFGTILLEGIPVRLSGQDSARGTFSQRHIVLTDVNTEEEIIPHNNIAPERATIEPLDSLLSEAGVLGFEFGYSTADPKSLVIWEAQFGDFANCAQPIIDNFISSSYTKWKLPNNLMMLLPHGQEGQGPEHSSARLERFLAMCAEGNITVCNPTTPSQYYHLIRGHAKYSNRRPLIVMTPKSLLRHPEARSSKKELLSGKFEVIIDDSEITNKNSVNRVIFTSGKFFYDLKKYRRDNKINDVALIRVERYYPYPTEETREVLSKYSNAKEVVWAQEEPKNMGALTFMVLRIKKLLTSEQKLYTVSREPSASPAPGSYKVWQETQDKLCREVFGSYEGEHPVKD